MTLTRTGYMRACGRQYPTKKAALDSKRKRLNPSLVAEKCWACPAWHLRSPKRPGRAALGQAKAAPKKRAARSTIPPKVRALVAGRDGGKCVRCPSARDLHQHHRRIKGLGGDTRPHADCACNIVTLCLECHEEDVHGAPAEAKAAGYIVKRSELFPGSVGVSVGTMSEPGGTWYPTCDGKWTAVKPEPSQEVAA